MKLVKLSLVSFAVLLTSSEAFSGTAFTGRQISFGINSSVDLLTQSLVQRDYSEDAGYTWFSPGVQRSARVNFSGSTWVGYSNHGTFAKVFFNYDRHKYHGEGTSIEKYGGFDIGIGKNLGAKDGKVFIGTSIGYHWFDSHLEDFDTSLFRSSWFNDVMFGMYILGKYNSGLNAGLTARINGEFLGHMFEKRNMSNANIVADVGMDFRVYRVLRLNIRYELRFIRSVLWVKEVDPGGNFFDISQSALCRETLRNAFMVGVIYPVRF